ncbi:phospho-N-acetylmuramoyl-pentapeptide-transferase [Verrucomicrobiaceae bacterium N1E253]|uniref:Phospho-N-acetylmuramoyl-pentapeptide-transferase n=1 Tax=Oceaniferula marina TaxID=2748318 RepID=A0A851GHD4_9BACT|nr:phospho-N-acetylmuramoyl-pentapeptide-transferase [Oceaniferula marina]
MLYWIYEFWRDAKLSGAEWAHHLRVLNLLQYITVRAGLASLITFNLSVFFGPWVIRKLISLKVGQPIRSADEVHKLNELHGGKAGTPTMGGVMILGSVLIAVLICGRLLNPFVVVTTCVMLALGLLGFVDDYTKVKLKSSDGVSGKTKLFWQFLVGGIAASFLYFKTQSVGYTFMGEEMSVSTLTFPLFKWPLIDIGWLCIPFFAIIIVGCSNAVNLTDGLDGLATGCTITVALAYAAIAYLAGHAYMAQEYLFIPFNRHVAELSVFLFALVGAGFGFLWYNCHPAKVFMGDTGSLAIGGGLATAAICAKQELLLVIIGWVFVMEALSVILQVASFKTTGKRIFAMSPIHHHFELRGWHETQVIVRFWTISIFCGLVGIALLKIV